MPFMRAETVRQGEIAKLTGAGAAEVIGRTHIR